MKQSRIIDERRKHVSAETRERVALSFQIVDRIHEILVARGLRQKDLAMMLGKSEAEISKWMRGTHNFTIDTIVAIEESLQAPILQVFHEMETA
jgi:transcriptional regulator with XRE-family HTH domain